VATASPYRLGCLRHAIFGIFGMSPSFQEQHNVFLTHPRNYKHPVSNLDTRCRWFKCYLSTMPKSIPRMKMVRRRYTGRYPMGHLKLAQILLEHNAEVDARDDDGRTPLHQVASRGQLKLAQMLLEHNAKVNCPRRTWFDPLHLAAYEGRIETACSNAEVNVQDHDGPLHGASKTEKSRSLAIIIGVWPECARVRQSRQLPISASFS
jgi:Ankyrin repeats (many copies)